MPNRIKEWRKLRGLTQEQLGGRLQTTGAQISRLERGEVPLDVGADSWGEKLAAALKIGVAELLGLRSAYDYSEVVVLYCAGRLSEQRQFPSEEIQVMRVPIFEGYKNKRRYGVKIADDRSHDKKMTAGDISVCIKLMDLDEGLIDKKYYHCVRKIDGMFEHAIMQYSKLQSEEAVFLRLSNDPNFERYEKYIPGKPASWEPLGRALGCFSPHLFDVD